MLFSCQVTSIVLTAFSPSTEVWIEDDDQKTIEDKGKKEPQAELLRVSSRKPLTGLIAALQNMTYLRHAAKVCFVKVHYGDLE